jgi:NarL family two-component system response regulator LiaR
MLGTTHGSTTYGDHACLALVLRGKSNREIADEAALTIRNVKYYMSRILEKLGVESRTDLLAGVFDRS